jgi:hypothetical protein
MKILVLLLALVAAAGAQAACEPGGMGGTGIRSDGGIGGTGIRAEADVGIIGVITGFGSICVNGIEVAYDSSTPVSTDGNAASPSALALGQLVAVRAVGNGLQARARDIQILDAVVGRASAVDPATGELQVAGQRVQLASSTIVAPGLVGGDLVGQNLRVSGLWRADGALAATRIERAPADAAPRVGAREWPELGTRQLIVEGYVADVRPDVRPGVRGNNVRIGGLSFGAEAGTAARLARDRLVRASGHVERDGMRRIERIELERLERERPERGGGDRGSADRPDRGDNRGPDRGDNRGPDRLDRPDRVDRPDRGGGVDRPERIERPDRSGPH